MTPPGKLLGIGRLTSQRLLASFVPWLLGFFLLANVNLLPFVKQQPTTTDLLGVVLGLWLLRQVITGVRATPITILFALSSIPFLWGLYAISVGDVATIVLSIRWLLAVPWAYALFTIARNSHQLVNLVWGLWWGCIANTLVMLLQVLGYTQLTQNFGLTPEDAALIANGVPITISELGEARATGMHFHPNGSAAVVSFIVPLSLYLYYARKTRLWVMIVGLGTMLYASNVTFTRSALLVSLVTILVVLTLSRDQKRTLKLVGLLVPSGLMGLYLLGPPGGWQRWLDSTEVTSNARIRLLTTVDSVELAFKHPLGLGVQRMQELLNYVEGTHNAFALVALIYGLLFAGALVLLLFYLALHVLGGLQTSGGLEAVLACQIFGLFFWEESLYDSSFIILTCWLVADAAVRMKVASRQRSPDVSLAPSRGPT